MPLAMNRALQVRTADRLRAILASDPISGLPMIDALSEQDQRELCDAGSGRLAAVAIRVACFVDGRLQPLDAPTRREVARMVDDHVRRTDLLGVLVSDTLLVLAPGLEPVGGRSLADRLRGLLANRLVEIGGVPVELRVRVGAAFRSAASPPGWTTPALAAEAEVNANPIEFVA